MIQLLDDPGAHIHWHCTSMLRVVLWAVLPTPRTSWPGRKKHVVVSELLPGVYRALRTVSSHLFQSHISLPGLVIVLTAPRLQYTRRDAQPVVQIELQCTPHSYHYKMCLVFPGCLKSNTHAIRAVCLTIFEPQVEKQALPDGTTTGIALLENKSVQLCMLYLQNNYLLLKS